MHRPDSPQMAPWPLSWIPRPRKRSKAVPHTFPVFCSILRCCNEHRSKSQNGGSTSFVFHTFRVKSGQSSSSASLHHHPGVLFLFRFVVLGSKHLFTQRWETRKGFPSHTRHCRAPDSFRFDSCLWSVNNTPDASCSVCFPCALNQGATQCAPLPSFQA